MLDAKTIELVKSTVPAIREHGLTITKTFYKNMFERSPEIVPFFNMDNQATGKQPKALAMTVLAAAENIDHLEKLAPAVEKVAITHCNCNVVPEQYPIIGGHLLDAFKEVLGDAITDEITEAWAKAYDVIAEIFIEAETMTAESFYTGRDNNFLKLCAVNGSDAESFNAIGNCV